MTNVAVIDDDFGPAKFSELPPDIQDAFLDEHTPESKNALTIIENLKEDDLPIEAFRVVEKYRAEDNLFEFLQSDEFATYIFLRSHNEILEGALKSSYADSHFATSREEANALKEIFNNAFGNENVTYFADRNTDIDVISKFDFLILDLFIKTPEDFIRDITSFLKHLVQHCEQLPPILLMSSHAELKHNLGKIRYFAEISAAGMVALSKREIRNSAGIDGVRLMWEQLHHQRVAASKTKTLISAWNTALENAKSKALETIWSLDASAMQQFHYTAFIENDPFDEHLSDLLSREYQWHVENNSSFQTSLSDLDKALLDEIDQTSMEIRHRFPQHHPHDEVKALSLIQAHYNWSGTLQHTELSNISEKYLQENFNRTIPFGAVLAEDKATAGSKAWIHVTQQCDLNKRDIYTNSSSILFLQVELVDATLPLDKKENEIILTGFPTQGGNLSLKVIPSRFWASPIELLHKFVTTQKLSVVGRLRIDIAKLCLQAFINHSSRPAAFSIQNKTPESFRAFLVTPGKEDNKTRAVKYEELNDPKKAKIIEVIKVGNKILFADDDCNRLALWLFKHGPSTDDNNIRSTLSAHLRQGIPSSEGAVAHISYAIHKANNFERCMAEINGIQVPSNEYKLILFTK